MWYHGINNVINGAQQALLVVELRCKQQSVNNNGKCSSGRVARPCSKCCYGAGSSNGASYSRLNGVGSSIMFTLRLPLKVVSPTPSGHAVSAIIQTDRMTNQYQQ